MPCIASTRDPVSLAHQVVRSGESYRFLVAVALPDLARPDGPPASYKLYASHCDCATAMREAVADNPGCTLHGEYERLHNADLAEIMAMHSADAAKDEKHAALRSLGLVKPDGTPLV